MKRGCGSGTDVMLARSLCLSVCLLVVRYRYHCFHSISQQSALVREKCFSILELCLCHIKASSLSCRFFISLRMCVCVYVCVCVSLSDQTWSLSYEEQLLQRKCFVILNLEDTCINPEFIVVLRSLEIINNIPL